jgi:cell division protease FtsH
MVTEFGMSESIGPVNHEGRRRNTFIDAPTVPERGAYGEETAGMIDTEVKRFVVTGEVAARRVLEERRRSLDELAERLLEKEVVEGEELRVMLGTPAPQTV